jgi:hemerythrin-like domain-containing protein
MKMDSNEMGQVVSADATGGRVDLYAGIHKAMRALMADILVAVGRLDPADDSEVEWIGARVLQFADFCHSHLRHENEFVHVALERRQPGASARIAAEHVEHEQAIADLKAAVGALQTCQGERRAYEALALYRQLALFIAHNFEHMHVEEMEHNAALWAHYSDAELQALEGELVASIPPEENMVVLRWMVPAMTPAERLQLLQNMRAHAPAPAFAAALEVVRPHLGTGDWAKLARGLQLAPVEGLVAA